ncbi:MAG: site-specific DNA-methyltransferase [Acidobacteriota bacterium]
MSKKIESITAQLANLNERELRRLLIEKLVEQKLGLVWEHNSIERDKALNADVVLPTLNEPLSCRGAGAPHDAYQNLIIEGDNFDALRLLKSTHANKIRVIYIDPPYNTGNKDWVYNDRYVGETDRWRHSQWLEFLYQRLTLARDLLAPNGVIMVSINDENRARLELLMDDVFPDMRVGSFVWRSRTGGNDTKGAFHSTNHEHVLVYGNPAFQFSGDEKSYSIYKHEEDGRIFYLSDLTSPKDLKERPNTFYPVRDPETNIYYPCNPGRVWAYATRSRVKEGQKLRGETIEDLIESKQIWFPPDQRVSCFETLEDLLSAIDRRDVPFSGKTPLLTRDTRDLEFWVGKSIGYGRPRLKKFKEGLKNENQPISSWLTPRQESDTVEPELNMPIVGTTEEGSKVLKDIMGEKVFQYPKPLSLISSLIAQAAGDDGIVLDFFAGSGTTAHAVLALNAEDGNRRRFILCGSTEAHKGDPDRNVCRDVCAERVRRVIEGYGDVDGLGGDFGYIELQKLHPADARLDATSAQSFQLLSLRTALAAKPVPSGPVKVVTSTKDLSVAYLSEVSAATIKSLVELPTRRLAVYSKRPQTVAEKLETSGKTGNSYAIGDVITAGQAGETNGETGDPQ